MTKRESQVRELFGLVGERLSHSFSADFFNAKFKAENINAEYINFELADISDIMEMLAENVSLKGFNVTIPYKTQIIPYLDYIDPVAKEINAVNVVKIERAENGDLRLLGFNTDVLGFKNSIVPLLKDYQKKALVLGSGGASKAIIYVLKELDICPTLVSRTAETGRLIYDDIDDSVMSENTVIVNTTPLGMSPKIDASPNLPYQLITSKHLCYDLIYNPGKTQFLEKSQQRGATIKNGLEMLMIQAFESWKIWDTAD